MKRKTLSIAESCTGGLLGHLITQTPGCSKYFMGGMITYSDEVKLGKLGIPKSAIAKHGAVSEVTAILMAKKVRRIFKTNMGIGITGIAGPDGGTKQKPVGLVFIAASTLKKTISRKYIFKGTRTQIKSQAAHAALNLLRAKILC